MISLPVLKENFSWGRKIFALIFWREGKVEILLSDTYDVFSPMRARSRSLNFICTCVAVASPLGIFGAWGQKKDDT
jgi:hypothetical protein